MVFGTGLFESWAVGPLGAASTGPRRVSSHRSKFDICQTVTPTT